MNTELKPPRLLVLEGAHNVRDLGGYAVAGGTTRWGIFFRADSLHQLTPKDRAKLLDTGIRTIIDLRHAGEVQAAPNIFHDDPQINYHHIPLIQGAPGHGEAQAPSLSLIYRYIVDDCQAQLSQVFTTMYTAETGGVLFHCSAGKDRTGIVAALLLGMVGASNQVIADDYGLTTQTMATLRPVLLAQSVARGGRTEDLEPLLASEPAEMEALLGYLNSGYGSLDAYLHTLQFKPDFTERIRRRFVKS